MKLTDKIQKLIGLAVLLCFPLWANAQTTTPDLITPDIAIYLVIALVFVLAIIVLGVSYNVYHIINMIVRNEEKKRAKAAGVSYVPEPSWWIKLVDSWTRSVPLEEEKSITLDHEYDGIRELDNHLPPWWLALFYGSIGFAVIYLFGYHVADWWPLQEEEYQIAEMKAAEVLAMKVASEGVIDENTVEYNSDPVYLAGGKSTFESSCATCHRADGGGLVGPNLTDEYWLHGGSISEIYTIIKNGVVSKGMASWQKALSPSKIAQVSSYILSIQGSNPPNPKPPQGDLVEKKLETPVNSEPVEDGNSAATSQ